MQEKFMSYEYKEIHAEENQMSFLLDCYENFGWHLDENVHDLGNRAAASKNVLHLKRDRKIINKAELTRLQRNFDACVVEIQMLEKRKTSVATMYSLAAGISGTVFMALSTFAITAQPPHVLLCIILAVPGFLGWIFPYFIYKNILQKQTERITPMIEEKYEEIYTLCEKGNKLLVSGMGSQSGI